MILEFLKKNYVIGLSSIDVTKASSMPSYAIRIRQYSLQQPLQEHLEILRPAATRMQCERVLVWESPTNFCSDDYLAIGIFSKILYWPDNIIREELIGSRQILPP